jgi:hypothetical protein
LGNSVANLYYPVVEIWLFASDREAPAAGMRPGGESEGVRRPPEGEVRVPARRALRAVVPAAGLTHLSLMLGQLRVVHVHVAAALMAAAPASAAAAAAPAPAAREPPSLDGAGVDVFVHGQRAANNNVTYPCIRIPSIVSATNVNALVAFMECRHSCADECWPKALEGTCWKGDEQQQQQQEEEEEGRQQRVGGAGSPLGGDVCMKRSTNGGASWGELLMVGPGGRSPSGLWDPLTKTITLAYSKYGSLDMYLRQSSDGGAHWSAPRSIDGVAGAANHSGFQPGTGVTIVGGPHAGRKLWALWGQVYIDIVMRYIDIATQPNPWCMVATLARCWHGSHPCPHGVRVRVRVRVRVCH